MKGQMEEFNDLYTLESDCGS